MNKELIEIPFGKQLAEIRQYDFVIWGGSYFGVSMGWEWSQHGQSIHLVIGCFIFSLYRYNE